MSNNFSLPRNFKPKTVPNTFSLPTSFTRREVIAAPAPALVPAAPTVTPMAAPTTPAPMNLTVTQEAVATTPLTGNEYVRIVQLGASAQTTLSNIAALVSTSTQNIIYVSDFGAKGDGVTDDSAAINAAGAQAMAIGATKIEFESGKTYYVASNILPRQNLIWEGNGCTLTASLNYPVLEGGMFHNHAQNEVPGQNLDSTTRLWVGDIVADVVGPTNQLTLDAIRQGLAVGDTIGMRIGTDPWDTPETQFCMICIVTAIAGNTITFDRVIANSYIINETYTYIPKNGEPATTVPISVGHQVGNYNGDCGNKTVWKFVGTTLAQNLVFRNFVFVGQPGSPGCSGGIDIQWGQNILIENCIGNPNGISGTFTYAMIELQFCQDVIVRNCRCYYNSHETAIFAMAEATNVTIENCLVTGQADPQALTYDCEAFCKNIIIKDCTDILGSITAQKYGLFIGGGSDATIHNHSVYHANSWTTDATDVWLSNGGQDSHARLTGTFKWRGPMFTAMSYDASVFACLFDYENGPEGYVRADFSNQHLYTVKIPLQPSMVGVNFQLPPIIPTQMDFYCSQNVSTSSVQALNFWNSGNNWSPKLVPGEVVNFANGKTGTFLGVTGGASYGFNALNGTIAGGGWVSVYTDTTPQLPGNFLAVTARCPRILETGPPPTPTVTVQTPDVIFGANLMAWYKADTGVTGTAPVTAWADQSGNARTLTMNTGAPFLNSTGLNGNPAIVFGFPDNFSSTVFNIASDVAGFFMVGRFNATQGIGGPRILAYSAGLSTDYSTPYSILAFTVAQPGFLTAFQNSIQSTDIPFTAGGVWIGAGYNGAAGTITQYINSTTGTVSTGFGNNTLGSASTAIYVGNTGPVSLEMVVSEIIMVNVNPTPTQLAAFANYATSKWGLVSASMGNNRSFPFSDTFMNDLVVRTRSPGFGGTFVANGATAVTVNNPNVQITDLIVFSLNTVGGTVGAIPTVKTITAGTGFTVAATASDTSTYNYILVKNQ